MPPCVNVKYYNRYAYKITFDRGLAAPVNS